MCLHCIVHFPADLRWVKVRASQPEAGVLVTLGEETIEVNGLSRPEGCLRETRDPPDLEGGRFFLLLCLRQDSTLCL